MSDETTPNGCRLDNGRAIDKVDVETDTQTAYVYFHDGSEYRYFGLDWVTLYAWAGQIDPGCYFNKFIAPGDFERIKGP